MQPTDLTRREPDPVVVPLVPDPAPGEPVAAKPDPQAAAEAEPVRAPPLPPPVAAYPRSAPASSNPSSDQLRRTLANAEYLLNYAVEAGIDVEPDVVQRIIIARRGGEAIWDGADAGALIGAITKLAAKLHPVTAETLRACREEAADAIRGYKRMAIWLAAFIIPLSMISFIYAGISNSITADLKTANELAVTLHTQLDTVAATATDQPAPPGSLSNLQQFATSMRAIYSRTRQLSWIVPDMAADPFGGSYAAMQLPPGLTSTIANMQTQVSEKTLTYQSVRLFATEVQDATSVVWGAVTTCILPVLYALLGACAYVLRSFTEQTEKRTFAPSFATPARFIIAGIGGGVVGLFSNFTIGQGASLSPLAIAFLIGYAADIFFSFLEGSMRTIPSTKPR